MKTTKRRDRFLESGTWEASQPSHVSEIAPHRQARLEDERERLEQRLAWAKARKDAGKVARLERQLAALDDDLEADLEGNGRVMAMRREYGEEMAAALGW